MTGPVNLPAHYRATVEYDGTAYQGFQRQLPEQPTVQGALEEALRIIANDSVSVAGAGRTDSGVHARGQVISFWLNWRHGKLPLQRALNANLPTDIAVRDLALVPASFHPRFDARRRTYEYFVYNYPDRSPLRHLRSWHVKKPLDLVRMNQAASCLIGQHDFVTFGRATQGDVTVRRLYVAEWQRRAEYLVFQITANAFLYHMVRSLVAALCKVGDGSWQIADFQDAFEACDRKRSAGLAPPQGLFLESVAYNEA